MSILEEFFAKILSSGKSTGKKARSVAEVLTLNADITGAQTRARDLQREIGEYLAGTVLADLDKETLQKLLAEEETGHRTIEIADWKELYQKLLFLRSEEEVISLNREKISRIRGEGTCPVCGETVQEGAHFCPNCGARIIKEEPAAGTEEETNE